MELVEHSEPAVVPGPLLRLTAAGGAASTGLVVASAALGLTTAHWGIAGVALPLLATTILARLEYPALLGALGRRARLLVVAIALGGVVAWSGTAPWAVALHVAAAGAALGAALLALAASLREAPPPLASARDYLTLTKPRIMSLLLVTGAAGMFVGAQGAPPLWLFAVTMTGLALACGGASALNHVLDRDIDALMGAGPATGRSPRSRLPRASARVRPLPLGTLVRPPCLGGELRPDRGPLRSSATSFLTVLVYTRWLKR